MQNVNFVTVLFFVSFLALWSAKTDSLKTNIWTLLFWPDEVK